MVPEDLPTPQRSKLSVEERQARKWQLIYTGFVLCTLYTLLHKLFVPAFLKLTPLQSSPYAQIDLWFWHSVLLTLLLRKQGNASGLASFFCGVGVIYGGYELYELLSGRLIGWLGFSKILSSIPIAFLCVVTLSTRSSQRSFKFAWIGSLSLFATLALWEYTQVGSKISVPTHKTAESPAPQTVLQTSLPVCGAQSLRAMEPIRQPESDGVIRLDECGLNRSVHLYSGKSIQIINNTDSGLTLHLVYLSQNKKRSGWNFAIQPKQQVQKDIFPKKGEAAVLYSDSAPNVGVAVLLPEPLPIPWEVSRSPLRLRFLQ